ncbi:MAG: class I SAM-dependent methyltransferase [Ruminococcus sp.]|nr:class I SAM-dependent methyltransferase [Ruminococcus sp.]
MSGYRIFSQFYDNLTFNVDYEKRADYIQSVLSLWGHEPGLALDLACGTGSLTIALKERGWDIFGIDGSQDMLSVAMDKAYDKELSMLFLCQQMEHLDLYGTIDTCVCTLDSLNHIVEKDKLQAAFDRVALFMNPEGMFVFDVNTVYKHRMILGNNTFIYDTDEVYCVWQNSLKENNIISIELDMFEREGNLYTRHTERFKERAYEIDELKEMLKNAGFETLAVYRDMTDEPLKEDSDRAVFVARIIEAKNKEY